MCNLVRRAPQNLEKVAKNPVEKIASNPVTSVAVMVFSALTKSDRGLHWWIAVGAVARGGGHLVGCKNLDIKQQNLGTQALLRSQELGMGWAKKKCNFRVWRFIEWPWPLHWIAFRVEFLSKAFIHWMPCPHSVRRRFSSLISASSHPLPRNLFQLFLCSSTTS